MVAPPLLAAPWTHSPFVVSRVFAERGIRGIAQGGPLANDCSRRIRQFLFFGDAALAPEDRG
jgi:hypothetical protein